MEDCCGFHTVYKDSEVEVFQSGLGFQVNFGAKCLICQKKTKHSVYVSDDTGQTIVMCTECKEGEEPIFIEDPRVDASVLKKS